jgi:hypothetical protein
MKTERKEYNRLENPKVMENVIFTTILTKDLLDNKRIGEYIEEMAIISYQQKFPILFTNIGMLGDKKDFDKLFNTLENSVLYN